MKEDFVQYVWQYQLFEKGQLKTIDDKVLTILKVGSKNLDSGPDFSQARIVLDNIEWAGHVEVHLSSELWLAHKHQEDVAYDNVILHVVWKYTKPIYRKDGSIIPTLELQNISFSNVVESYKNLIAQKEDILCAKYINNCTELSKIAMLEKALAHRFEKKSKVVLDFLYTNNNDWEETAYQVLGQNMGFKLNADPFLKLTQILPFRILKKHKGNLFQMEALIYGQAGFLEEAIDDYQISLKGEYNYLAQKYCIFENRMNKHEWKFLRTRPSNFPSIRMAQFAAILNNINSLFSFFIEKSDTKEFLKVFKSAPSEYWKTHLIFGKESNRPNNGMGKSSIETILINTCVNLLISFSKQAAAPKFFETAVEILEEILPEKNFIIAKWQNLGLNAANGFDSQALIEQYNEFCIKKRCVSCAVGAEILKNTF